MTETEVIICPHCHVAKANDIHEYTTPGDMDGSFELECFDCHNKFMVEFEFKPFIRTF